MKKLIPMFIFAMALAAAGVMPVAPAEAIDVAISGHVNRAAMYADDGESAKWFFVDNANSSSRFRFRGANDFDGGWQVGIFWEVEMKSNASNRVSMQDNSDLSGINFEERHLEAFVRKWGTARLGQGDTATNGTAEVDLSGTDVAAYSSVDDIGGNFEFRDGNDRTGITVSNSRSNFDGLSRRDRFRYDTPRWAGLFASVSFEGNSEWDLAARYAADFGWARLAAAAGWADFGTSADSDDGNRDGQFSSSASLLLKNGLNFTASYAVRDQDQTDPWNLYGKFGYKFLGKHAASIQYSRTKHLSNTDDKGDTFGLAYVFTPFPSVEFYGTYYLHMLELDDGDDPDDINIFLLGTRVRF